MQSYIVGLDDLKMLSHNELIAFEVDAASTNN